ncbi:MAG TPA: 3'-5' exonuclease, partial [Usitatibacteraceae bacterium]|nr:3'-5' exonuclease [Usitatibacteraceae bacterium]
DRLFAGPAAAPDEDAALLQIMTIHKAKGLEFDTVIIPGLHRGSRQDEKKLLAWSEQLNPETGEREILLAPIREAGGEDEADAIYRCVQRVDREKQQHEDVRLLYVASTRAKSRLHWLAAATVTDDEGGKTLRKPRRGSLLAALWPAVEAVFAAAIAAPEAAPAQAVGAPIEPSAGGPQANLLRLSSTQEWPVLAPAVPAPVGTGVMAPRATIEFDWAGETARHVGTVVHAFLQRVAETGLERWPRSRLSQMQDRFAAELARLGVGEAERAPAARRVIDALANAIDGERGRWLLAAQREARCEWRLSGIAGGDVVNIAIDRSFIDDAGTRWIVDYKTGSHGGADPEAFLDNEQRRYRAQLEQYAALVHALETSPRPIRLGLYFPLMNGWREWPWDPG